MVALEAQIAHSERRLKSAKDLAETIRRDEEKQEEKLGRLQKELETVKKAANAAQGESRDPTSKLHTD
jgi:structural maintenance of chromosome 1